MTYSTVNNSYHDMCDNDNYASDISKEGTNISIEIEDMMMVSGIGREIDNLFNLFC